MLELGIAILGHDLQSSGGAAGKDFLTSRLALWLTAAPDAM